MHAQQYYAVGLMSGTSLDGLDIAYSSYTKDGENWSFELLKSKSVSYSEVLESDLRNSVKMSALELTELHSEYGRFLAEQVRIFIEEEKIVELDVIGSHGHTVFHNPDKGYTLQIGDALWIHKIIEKTVVADFRVQDVVLGGQGAPLVPVGDKSLFSEYDYRVNLGGFANISFEKEGREIAFDICPVNTILNKFANRLGLDYDDKGSISKSGKIIPEMLKKLDGIDFYKMEYPKSLGVEWNEEMIFPIIDFYEKESIEDLLSTFTHHIANQISETLIGKDKTVLLSGGGAYNDFLISLIKERTSHKLVIADQKITDFKEAIIFGFLAILRIRNEVNCLAEVTGAEKDHSTGIIYNFNTAEK